MAYELLASVDAWFNEGFDTPDLIQAEELLDALAEGKNVRAGSLVDS